MITLTEAVSTAKVIPLRPDAIADVKLLDTRVATTVSSRSLTSSAIVTISNAAVQIRFESKLRRSLLRVDPKA